MLLSEAHNTLTKIELKFPSKSPVGNSLALVHSLFWRQIGNKHFLEPVVIQYRYEYIN